MTGGGLRMVSSWRLACKVYLNDEEESWYREAVFREKAQLVQRKTRRKKVSEGLAKYLHSLPVKGVKGE